MQPTKPHLLDEQIQIDITNRIEEQKKLSKELEVFIGLEVGNLVVPTTTARSWTQRAASNISSILPTSMGSMITSAVGHEGTRLQRVPDIDSWGIVKKSYAYLASAEEKETINTINNRVRYILHHVTEELHASRSLLIEYADKIEPAQSLKLYQQSWQTLKSLSKAFKGLENLQKTYQERHKNAGVKLVYCNPMLIVIGFLDLYDRKSSLNSLVSQLESSKDQSGMLRGMVKNVIEAMDLEKISPLLPNFQEYYLQFKNLEICASRARMEGNSLDLFLPCINQFAILSEKVGDQHTHQQLHKLKRTIEQLTLQNKLQKEDTPKVYRKFYHILAESNCLLQIMRLTMREEIAGELKEVLHRLTSKLVDLTLVLHSEKDTHTESLTKLNRILFILKLAEFYA